MNLVRRALDALVDAVLGPRCSWCTTRVFPRDRVAHYHVCRRP